MGALPPFGLRLGVLDAVGAFKEISVVGAERDNNAIVDLESVLETKPTFQRL